MNRHLPSLLVAVALTIGIGVVSGGGWPFFVMGAGFTLSLFVVLLFSTYGKNGESVSWPSWATFAGAAAITLVLGSVLLWIGERDNGAWWGAAVIMAAAIMWPVTNRSLLDGSASAKSG